MPTANTPAAQQPLLTGGRSYCTVIRYMVIRTIIVAAT